MYGEVLVVTVCCLCLGVQAVYRAGCWVFLSVLGGGLGVGWLSTCCVVVRMLGACLGVGWLSGCSEAV